MPFVPDIPYTGNKFHPVVEIKAVEIHAQIKSRLSGTQVYGTVEKHGVETVRIH